MERKPREGLVDPTEHPLGRDGGGGRWRPAVPLLTYTDFPPPLLPSWLQGLKQPPEEQQSQAAEQPRLYRTKSTPIVKADKAASESTTRRIIIYGVQDENGSNIQNFALDITPPPEVIYKSEPGTSDGMNVLGIFMINGLKGKPDGSIVTL
ncbi:hypothetical protein JD844_017981 [Phrynosoma platyrhinos]|uniref:Uncharacterized protein n=1 Tax=Phrynosoma platyrhinos TaxID=52577 RepID=A0ABQ7SMP5_PHRPL|nr:hypothetical protein JD844_017981 [Phrynosoma platyrhinos]